ncbi:MAG: hypothetical protein QOG07_89 [Pseudonocardiales bacterium]|jgi:hypothetical protein|nr:hypothetical protein [Pseudonocardiales bacterium]MDT4978210.1 hypothetical protein [Pseudonocardiales bacterium]MDX6205709.1 hypothetical protein [Frankiales bacterium]MDX6245726.1 hypothetical protein [Frankiales bacterium]
MSEDVVWRLLEWVDGPAAEHKDVVRDVLGRHPEIDGLTEEWLRVDVVCGRDGVSRKRFMVRTSPPPVRQRRRPRRLP